MNEFEVILREAKDLQQKQGENPQLDLMIQLLSVLAERERQRVRTTGVHVEGVR